MRLKRITVNSSTRSPEDVGTKRISLMRLKQIDASFVIKKRDIVGTKRISLMRLKLLLTQMGRCADNSGRNEENLTYEIEWRLLE